MMKKRSTWALGLGLFLLISGILYGTWMLFTAGRMPRKNAYVMALSISSDGKYAISTHINEFSVLWDLDHGTHQIISRHANVFSAYFIKNTHDFMFQDDKTNIVFVENIQGQIIKKIMPGFTTFGEVLTTDLHHYFTVDKNDALFEIGDNGLKQKILYHYCDTDASSLKPPQGQAFLCGGYEDSGQLFHLALSSNDQFLVSSSGYDTLYIWDVATGQLTSKINAVAYGETNSALSPDNRKLITVSYNMGRAFEYDIGTRELTTLDIPTPKLDELPGYDNFVGDPNFLSVHFLDDRNFIVVLDSGPFPIYYVGLYALDHLISLPRPYPDSPSARLSFEKYLAVAPYPNPSKIYPDTSFAIRSQAVDSAPQAHILVMGENMHNGIMVYRYDPQAKTLTNIATLTIDHGK